MSRAAILPPPSSHIGDRQHHTGGGPSTTTFHELPSRPMVPAEPSPPDLFRAAAEAVTQLVHTLRDCAREVEARGGQRVARGMLEIDRGRALAAIFFIPMPPGALSRELDEMAEGIRLGYVREAWSLRLLQMAAEAPARDTEPEPAAPCAYCDDPTCHEAPHG